MLMNKYFITILFFILSFSVSLEAQDQRAVFFQSAAGQTVLLGTYMWDIESDSFPSYPLKYNDPKKADIWWHQIDNTIQEFYAKNGAAFADVSDRSFWALTPEDLQKLQYSGKPIPNTKLEIEAVIAMRTSDGNSAKLRITGHRALHDFSFKEAEILREEWKAFVLQRENLEKYHIEIDWVLYTKQYLF